MGQSLCALSYSTAPSVKRNGNVARVAGGTLQVCGIACLESRSHRSDDNPMKNKQSYRRHAFEVVDVVLEERRERDGQRKSYDGARDSETDRTGARGDARASAARSEGVSKDGPSVAFDADRFGVLEWADLNDSRCDQRAATEKKKEETPEWSSSPPRSMEEPRDRDINLTALGFDGATALRLFTPIHSSFTKENKSAPEPHNRLLVPTPPTGELSALRPDFTHRTKDAPVSPEEEYVHGQGLIGYHGFPGTIPRLIVTHDSSPSHAEDAEVAEFPLRFGALSLDVQPGHESPYSDSGCGGSPIPRVSLRKLSSSSSAGLSSASSFEESEDDITASDVEPAGLSPSTRVPCGSPEELSRVSE